MESTQTEGRSAKGRKGPDKQELVTKPEIIKAGIDNLVTLHHHAGSAAETLNDAVKALAEKSGYNASAVRKFMLARAGEKYEEMKKLAEQQLELFEEVGER